VPKVVEPQTHLGQPGGICGLGPSRVEGRQPERLATIAGEDESVRTGGGELRQVALQIRDDLGRYSNRAYTRVSLWSTEPDVAVTVLLDLRLHLHGAVQQVEMAAA
jgi:hypothetical protein